MEFIIRKTLFGDCISAVPGGNDGKKKRKKAEEVIIAVTLSHGAFSENPLSGDALIAECERMYGKAK